MFCENLHNIGKIENFKVSNILISLANQLFILRIFMNFYYEQTFFNIINFVLICFYGLHLNTLTLENPEKLEDFNKTQSFRLRVKYNPILIKITLIYLIALLLAQIFSSIDIQKFYGFVNFATFFIAQINFANIFNIVLQCLICYILILMNKNVDFYYDFYKFKIYHKTLNYFKILVYLVVAFLIYYKKNQEEMWSSLNALENLITTIFMMLLVLFYELNFYQIVQKYLRVMKYIILVKLMILNLNYVFDYLINIYQGNTILIYIQSELKIFRYTRYIHIIIIYYAILFICLNYVNFISEFNRIFKVQTNSIKYREIFQNSHQLFLIKSFPKQILKMLNILNKDHPQITLDYGLKYNFFKELKQIHFFKKNFEISLKARYFSRSIPLKFIMYEKIHNFYSIIKLYRFQVLKIILDLTLIFILTKMINTRILCFFLFFEILLLIAQPDYQLMKFYIIITNLLPFVFYLFILIIEIFIYKFILNQFQEDNKYLKMYQLFMIKIKTIMPFDIYILTLIFIINFVYLFLQFKIDHELHKKKDFSIFQVLKTKKHKIIEINDDLLIVVKNLFNFLLILTRYVILGLILLYCLYYSCLFNIILLIAMFFTFLLNKEVMYQITCNIFFSFTILKYLTKFENFFPQLNSYMIFFIGLFFDQKYLFKDNQSQQDQKIFYFHIQLCAVFFLINRLITNRKQNKKIFINQKYTKFNAWYQEIKNYILLVIDKSKIYLIYFYMLKVCFDENFQKSSYLEMAEFIFTFFMITHHVLLLIIKGHIKSLLFFWFFILYLGLIVFNFFMTYIYNFGKQLSKDIDQNTIQNQWNYIIQQSNENNKINILKIIFCIIAIKSLFQNLNQKKQQKKEFERESIKNIFIQVFQLCAVFAKEVQLYLTIKCFIESPNFFGLLYLGSYLIYFVDQISSLFKILEKYKFKEMIYLKYLYYKNYLLEKKTGELEELQIFFDSFYQDSGSLYYLFFRKEIFSCLYKKVNANWKFSYIILATYMISVYFLLFQSQAVEQKFGSLFLDFLFNFNSYETSVVKQQFDKLINVLFIIIIEIYFVNALKIKNTEDEQKIADNIPFLLEAKYKFLSIYSKTNKQTLETQKGMLLTIQQKIKEVKEFLKSKQQQKILKKYQPPQQEPGLNEIFPITNLNQKLDKSFKSLLLVQNRHKTDFLQIINAFLFFMQKILFIPISFGFIFGTMNSIQIMIGLVLLVVQLRNQTNLRSINLFNIFLAFITLFEYVFFYLKKFMKTFNFNSNIFSNFDGNIRILIYMFNYASFFKLFFMICIILCYYGIYKLDHVRSGFFKGVKKFGKLGFDNGYMIDYGNWVDHPLYICHALKNYFLLHLGSIYFLIALFYYLFSSQMIQFLGLFFLVGFKMYFNFKLKKPFNYAISHKYRKIFVFFNVLNWLIFFSFVTDYNKNYSTPILSDTVRKIIFICLLYLNMLILSIIDNQEVVKEFQKLEKFYHVKEQLVSLLKVYSYNEENTFKNTKQIITVQLMEKKLQEIFPDDLFITQKGNLFRQIEMSLDLKNINVFVDNKVYENHLFSHLRVFQRTMIKFRLFIRSKLFLTNSSSKNYLSLLSVFVEKNKHFIGKKYSFDLFKLIIGDVEEIKLLIQKVRYNNTLFKQKQYVQTIHEKMNQFNSRYTPTTPILPKIGRFENHQNSLIKKQGISQAKNALYEKLVNDDHSMLIHKAPSNTFFDCIYKHKIDNNTVMLILNYDKVNAKLNDYKNINFTMRQYILAIWNIFMEDLNQYLNIILILIFAFCEGSIGVVFIFIHIYFILIENQILSLENWKRSYTLYIVILAIKQILGYLYNLVPNSIENFEKFDNKPSQEIASWIFFFFGKMENWHVIVIFCIYELVFSRLGHGYFDKDYSQIENNSQAIFRLSFNQNLKQIFDQKNKLILANFFYVEEKVKQKFKKVLSEKDYNVFIVKLLRKKVEIYRDLKEKFQTYFKILKNLVPVYNQDKAFFEEENYKSYFWRNFTCHKRKTGKNFEDQLLTILVLILLFIFIFFFRLINAEKSVVQSILNNDIQGTMSINLTIFFFYICLERYLSMRGNYKWMNNTQNHRDQVISLLKARNINFKNILINENNSQNKISKFKKLVRKIICVLKLKKPSQSIAKDNYQYNPLLFRFFSTLIIWIYSIFLVHIFLPLTSHNLLNKDADQNMFLCNNYFQTENIYVSFQKPCNNYQTNWSLQILFILINIYVILSITQIKNGYSRISHIKYINYKSLIHKIKFYIYKYTPFIREMKILIDYASSDTSLNFNQQFQLEDMETSITHARVNEISNQIIHDKKKRLKNKSIACFIFLFFFLLLIIPLYIFSDILPNKNINKVKSAKFQLFLKTQNLKFVVYQNEDNLISNIDEDSHIYQKIKKLDKFKNYSSDFYSKIVFGKISPYYIDFTQNIVDELEDHFEKQQKLSLELKLDLDTEHKGLINKSFQYELNNTSSQLILNKIKNQNCYEDFKIDFTLGLEQKMIIMSGLSHQSQQYSTPDFDFIIVLQLKCQKKINKLTFNIFDKQQGEIQFYLLNENIKSSVEILQKIYKDQVSLFSIYLLIFSYLGITIIRKGFLDQPHRYWITEMPNAEKLETYINLVFYSKFKGDLYREELFFYYLLDLFRNPDKIKQITGDMKNFEVYNREVKWY